MRHIYGRSVNDSTDIVPMILKQLHVYCITPQLHGITPQLYVIAPQLYRITPHLSGIHTIPTSCAGSLDNSKLLPLVRLLKMRMLAGGGGGAAVAAAAVAVSQQGLDLNLSKAWS